MDSDGWITLRAFSRNTWTEDKACFEFTFFCHNLTEALAQLQQQTQATTPQLDAIEKQIYDANQNLRNKRKERLVKANQYEEKLEDFNAIPPEEEETRLQTYEELIAAREAVTTIDGELENLLNQTNQLTQQRDNILKQKSQAQAQASTAMKQADSAIKDQENAMRNIGKQMQENIIKQYFKKRKNTNLMEQMDSYRENTRGSLKKFFEMFEKGKTNEEVLQHYAKEGIKIPESYIQKAKKNFESYKKLKLELGFLEQEAKDFKKPLEISQEEEQKQLSTKLFKK